MVALSFLLVPFLGRNFFPSVDAGNILMHVRTQVGTRVEETANQLADVQKAIRKIIPPGEIETLADNIGMPISGINMTYNNTGVIGPQDGDIQIKLREGHSDRRIRPGPARAIAAAVSRHELFVSAGRYRQPDPDFWRAGADRPADPRREPRGEFRLCNKLLGRIRKIPGIADARIQQSPNNPTFNIDLDRTRAQYVGLTSRDVTNSLVVNLAGSSQVAPTYYLNPDNGVSYSIVMQTPQYQMELAQRAAGAADHRQRQPPPPILGGIADVKRAASSAAVSQYDIQPMVQFTPPRRVAISARWRPTSGRDRGYRQGRAEGLVGGPARPGADHGERLLRPAVGPAGRGGADLFPDRGELPVLARSVRDHHGAAGGLAGIVWMLFPTHTTLWCRR